MSDDKTTMERLRANRGRKGYPSEYLDDVQIAEFAESAVRAALAPREQSPELVEAEKWLRSAAKQQHGKTPVILEELDRLRASLATIADRLDEAARTGGWPAVHALIAELRR